MPFKKDNLTPVFGALCFFFSAVEYLFPKPLPFLRLGLANLPLLVGLELLTLRQYALVVLIKIIGQGLIGGTLFSYVFLFSAAGTLSSAAVMYGLRKLFPRAAGFAGISIAGALVSNGAQLVLARYILFGKSAWLVAPPFLALGTVTALFLGLFADYFTRKSRWFAALKTDSDIPVPLAAESGSEGGVSSLPAGMDGSAANAKKARRFFGAGLAILPFLLFVPGLFGRAETLATVFIFMLIMLLLLISRRKFALLPLVFMSAAIVFFNLLSPAGRVLWQLGAFRVTQTALETGLVKALKLGGMLLLSRWMIRPGLTFPGKVGFLVSRSFIVFERLTDQKKRFDRRRLMESIDEILFEATC